jgi:chromosome segregation ATPase
LKWHNCVSWQAALAQKEEQISEHQAAVKASMDQLASLRQHLESEASDLPKVAASADKHHDGAAAARGASAVSNGNPDGLAAQLAELREELARRGRAATELRRAAAEARDTQAAGLRRDSEAAAALYEEVAALKRQLDAANARADGHFEALQDSSVQLQVKLPFRKCSVLLTVLLHHPTDRHIMSSSLRPRREGDVI